MLEKEFNPYEQALELREIGFNEECFGYYFENQGEYFPTLKGKPTLISPIYSNKERIEQDGNNNNNNNNNYPNFLCLAPLWQQAFDFFRDEYKFNSFIDIDYTYRIYGNNRYIDIDSSRYETYEEARLECLKKLIEIVKNEIK